jgi:hypothetical protein
MYHHTDLDEPPEGCQACARSDHYNGRLGPVREAELGPPDVGGHPGQLLLRPFHLRTYIYI